MKYKIGDTVRIRSDLVCNRWYGGDSVIADMMPYLGATAAIEKEGMVHGYRLVGIDWTWTDEMLEPASNECVEIERLKSRVAELEKPIREVQTPDYGAMIGKLVWAWDASEGGARIGRFKGISDSSTYPFKVEGGFWSHIRPATEEEVTPLIYRHGK